MENFYPYDRMVLLRYASITSITAGVLNKLMQLGSSPLSKDDSYRLKHGLDFLQSALSAGSLLPLVDIEKKRENLRENISKNKGKYGAEEAIQAFSYLVKAYEKKRLSDSDLIILISDTALTIQNVVYKQAYDDDALYDAINLFEELSTTFLYLSDHTSIEDSLSLKI